MPGEQLTTDIPFKLPALRFQPVRERSSEAVKQRLLPNKVF